MKGGLLTEKQGAARDPLWKAPAVTWQRLRAGSTHPFTRALPVDSAGAPLSDTVPGVRLPAPPKGGYPS